MVAVPRVEPSPAASGDSKLTPWRRAQANGPTALQIAVCVIVLGESGWLAYLRVLPGEAVAAIFPMVLAYVFREHRRNANADGDDGEV